jgi:diacylglycerol kinase (ATP)
MAGLKGQPFISITENYKSQTGDIRTFILEIFSKPFEALHVFINKKLKNLLFIINPTSGTASKEHLKLDIPKYFDETTYHSRIFFTQYAGHAQKIAAEHLENTDLLIVAGGDGTIHEILPELLQNPKVVLAILPYGSGNGIAGYFHLSNGLRNLKKQLEQGKTASIDVGKINDRPFLGFVGWGLDASIAARFAGAKKRGFMGYCWHALAAFVNYKPIELEYSKEGKVEKMKDLYLFTIANIQQFGNRFFIAPQAKIDDGLLDICWIQKFPLYQIPVFLYYIFTQKIQRFKYYKTEKISEIQIKTSDQKINIDGESDVQKHISKIQVQQGAISLLIN